MADEAAESGFMRFCGWFWVNAINSFLAVNDGLTSFDKFF